MSVRRSLVFLMFVIVFLPLGIFGSSRSAVDPAVEQLRNLQLYRVERGDVTQTVSAIGSIEPEAVVQLSFSVPGRVRDLWVQLGDYVLQGDVLVELDNDNQRIAYENALLGLERAEVDLEELYAPVSEDNLRLANANIDAAWGAYLSIENAVTDDDIAAAQLSYDRAFAVYEDLKDQRDQAPGGYGSTNYNQLDAQMGAASFNAEIARLQLESLKNSTSPQLNSAYARVVVAEREKERLLAGPTQFEVDTRTLAVTQVETQVSRAEVTYDKTTLVAPFDSVVSLVNVEQGALVGPGAQAIELTDISPLHVTIQVDEVDIGQIEEGMRAVVELDALPGVQLDANLDSIATVGVNTGGIVSYDVDVTLNGNDERVRVGMTAEATIIIDERADVLVIPNQFIRLDRRTNRAFVNVMDEDNDISEIEIVLGLRGQERSEVLSGLEEGDIIVVDVGGKGLASLLGE